MSLCMRVLHTSDWHLGQRLYGLDRTEEFSHFLSWLLETIEEQAIDVLLIAGDMFDSSTPTHAAQELYYSFLSEASKSCCKHVVVIGGNHDSPSLLNATQKPLKNLNVHVIGSAKENLEEEIFALEIDQNVPELFVCAVPFLRESDVRISQPDDTFDDKTKRIFEGIAAHYKEVCERADQTRKAQNPSAPLIAMGHLFTAGGATGEGVRDLYIGNLEGIHASIFPDCIDYLALGHLHVPQKVAGKEYFRYSGSPLPMGFDERNQQKQVCLIEFEKKQPTVSSIAVPTFRALQRAEGSLEQILTQIELIQTQKETTSSQGTEHLQSWLDVKYTGTEIIPDLKDQVTLVAEKAGLKVVHIPYSSIYNPVLKQIEVEQSLEELDHTEIFQKLLDKKDFSKTEQKELLQTYREATQNFQEKDELA